MFCANTRPVPVAVTDLGEMSPPMLTTSANRPSDAGGRASGAAAEGGVAAGEGISEDAAADVDGAAGAEVAPDGAVGVEQPARVALAHRAATQSRRRGRMTSSSS